jgi:peroxiredoxin
MATKLNTGDTFPRMTLKLTDGSQLALPDGRDTKYKIVLFYRGHW